MPVCHLLTLQASTNRNVPPFLNISMRAIRKRTRTYIPQASDPWALFTEFDCGVLAMILSDNETKVDLLNNEAIAKTIVMLLRERTDQPVTIAVHGDWGAGKSSVLEMIDASLNSQDRVLCLKFNGWRFQGFEDAKIALIEGIVTGLIEKRPLLTKAGDAVKDIFHRIDMLKAAKKVGGLALTAYAGLHGVTTEFGT